MRSTIHPRPPESQCRFSQQGMAEIVIKDQGIGIPGHDLDRIFERFYRVDQARSRSTGGTGLGLSIVKHVCQNHGGECTVWSEVGTGSTFTLRLPVYDPHTDMQRQAQELDIDVVTTPEQGRIVVTRVLVVEDEESFSDALTFMLEREGYEVAVAADGNAALEEFEKSGADILLLDLMLPGLPGTEVCRQIRTRSQVPIIMLTAKDGEVDKVVGLELGADDYVTKPFSSRELLARIRAVLRRNGELEELLPAAIEAGPVRMDVDRHVVTVRGEQVSMPLKSSTCWKSWCAIPGECSLARNSSTGCGGRTTSGTPRRWTFTSNACGPKWKPILRTRHLVTVRGLGYKYDA